MIDIELDKFTYAEANVVQDRDYRLVSLPMCCLEAIFVTGGTQLLNLVGL
jgi:hypothetical protein